MFRIPHRPRVRFLLSTFLLLSSGRGAAASHEAGSPGGRAPAVCARSVFSHPALHWYFPGLPVPPEFASVQERASSARASLPERPDTFLLRLVHDALGCEATSQLSESLTQLLDRLSARSVCDLPPGVALPSAERTEFAALLEAVKAHVPALLRRPPAERELIERWLAARLAPATDSPEKKTVAPFDSYRAEFHHLRAAVQDPRAKPFLAALIGGETDPAQSFSRHVMGFTPELHDAWEPPPKRSSCKLEIDPETLGPKGTPRETAVAEREKVARLYSLVSEVVRGCAEGGFITFCTLNSKEPLTISVYEGLSRLCSPTGRWDEAGPHLDGKALGLCGWAWDLSRAHSSLRPALSRQLRAMARAIRLGRDSVTPTPGTQPFLARLQAAFPTLATSAFAARNGFVEPAAPDCRPSSPETTEERTAPMPSVAMPPLTIEDFRNANGPAPLDCTKRGLAQENGGEFTERELAFLRRLERLTPDQISAWVRESDPIALRSLQCRVRWFARLPPGESHFIREPWRVSDLLQPHAAQIAERADRAFREARASVERRRKERESRIAAICRAPGKADAFSEALAWLVDEDPEAAQADFIAGTSPGRSDETDFVFRFQGKQRLERADVERFLGELGALPRHELDRLARQVAKDDRWVSPYGYSPEHGIAIAVRIQVKEIVLRYQAARHADARLRDLGRRVLSGNESLAELPPEEAEAAAEYLYFLASDAKVLARRGCSSAPVETLTNARMRALAQAADLSQEHSTLADQLWRMDESALAQVAKNLQPGGLVPFLHSVEKIRDGLHFQQDFTGEDPAVERVPDQIASALKDLYRRKLEGVREAIRAGDWKRLEKLTRKSAEWLPELWMAAQINRGGRAVPVAAEKALQSVLKDYGNEITLLASDPRQLVVYESKDGGGKLVFLPGQKPRSAITEQAWNDLLKEKSDALVTALGEYQKASERAGNENYLSLLTQAYAALADEAVLRTEREKAKEEKYERVLEALHELAALGIPRAMYAEVYPAMNDLLQQDSEALQRQGRKFAWSSAGLVATAPFISARLLGLAATGVGFGAGIDSAQQFAKMGDAALRGERIPDFDWSKLVASMEDGAALGVGIAAASHLPLLGRFVMPTVKFTAAAGFGISAFDHLHRGEPLQALTDIGLGAAPLVFHPRPSRGEPADALARRAGLKGLTRAQKERLAESLKKAGSPRELKALLELPNARTGIPDFKAHEIEALTRHATPPPTEGKELTPWQRLDLAEAVLERPITDPRQRLAVEQAHRIGEGELGADGTPARFGNYTPQQIQDKFTKLRNADFTKQEAHALLDAGVCGKGPRVPFTLLQKVGKLLGIPVEEPSLPPGLEKDVTRKIYARRVAANIAYGKLRGRLDKIPDPNQWLKHNDKHRDAGAKSAETARQVAARKGETEGQFWPEGAMTRGQALEMSIEREREALAAAGRALLRATESDIFVNAEGIMYVKFDRGIIVLKDGKTMHVYYRGNSRVGFVGGKDGAPGKGEPTVWIRSELSNRGWHGHPVCIADVRDIFRTAKFKMN